jgi:hypothetical protein
MPTYNQTVSTSSTTFDANVSKRNLAAKSLTTTPATGQSVSKLMGHQYNKTLTTTPTTGQSVTPIRSRPYSQTASTSSTTAVSMTLSRGRLKVSSNSATTSDSVTASKSKNNICSTNVQTSDSLVRNGSTFNRIVTEVAKTYAGVLVREKLASVYFYYPPNGPTMQVGLRNPNFGNAHALHLQTISKRSRSGVLFIFKRTPTYESFKLDFNRIDEDMFNRLITFMKATAGQVIQYLDHKGVKWNGYILTDPFELVNDHKGLSNSGQRVDWYTLSLQFEGSIVK